MLENDFFVCTDIPNFFWTYTSLVCDLYWVESSQTTILKLCIAFVAIQPSSNFFDPDESSFLGWFYET